MSIPVDLNDLSIEQSYSSLVGYLISEKSTNRHPYFIALHFFF